MEVLQGIAYGTKLVLLEEMVRGKIMQSRMMSCMELCLMGKGKGKGTDNFA